MGMGSAGSRDGSAKASVPETNLEAKVLDTMRKREAKGTSIISFNSIIRKFPKIDESVWKCKKIFEESDEDGNGAIDLQELKHCFRRLEIDFTDEEVNNLFEACNINEDMAIKFAEFIVLLCLVYLLREVPKSQSSREGKKTAMGMPSLEATFETLVDAFVFLDKNKDGYVSKSEMVDAINESSYGERSSGRIAMKRFEEMDWDKNGMVNFKEFLFAFTHWVGIEDMEDEDEDEEEV